MATVHCSICASPWTAAAAALVISVLYMLRKSRYKHKKADPRSSARNTAKQPKSWPILGCTLELASNLHRLYDWVTDYAHTNPTFEASYLSFRLLFTVDPANVEHILKSNFPNYIKGPASHEIQFELLGNGIFNTDGHAWKLQRKSASLEFSSKILRNFSTPTFRKYAVKLAQVLAELGNKNQDPGVAAAAIDLQDLFMRMTLDSICELGFGVELGSLDVHLPEVAFAEAFDRSNSACASRYFDPLWKIKRLLGIGSEAQLRRDVRILNDFTYSVIQKRRRESQKRSAEEEEENEREQSDLLSRFMAMAEQSEQADDEMLRDAVLNFIIAGRDTTATTLSWLFWILSRNPGVDARIRQEIREKVIRKHGAAGSRNENEEEKISFQQFSELLTYESLMELDYLQAAICETLRLYPAVPLDGKTAISSDVLPDGTIINKGDVVNYVPYAMGRIRALWGDDAESFRPDRWIHGHVFVPQSAFKFTAFQGGPRICLGKDFALLQMKMASALLVWFFRFEFAAAAASHDVGYSVALTLHMKSTSPGCPALPMLVHRRFQDFR